MPGWLFAARRPASAVYAMALFASVGLSQAGLLLKRLNVSSVLGKYTVSQNKTLTFLFFE